MTNQTDPAALVVGYEDVRKWFYYPIEMPVTAEGMGPATVGVDASKITYEVWDVLLNSHGSFDNLPDAINEAIRLNTRTLPALTVVDAKALVKAALEMASVEMRPVLRSMVSRGAASEHIRALADDPDTVAEIVEQVKGETDE